jgi:hypothetical protein
MYHNLACVAFWVVYEIAACVGLSAEVNVAEQQFGRQPGISSGELPASPTHRVVSTDLYGVRVDANRREIVLAFGDRNAVVHPPRGCIWSSCAVGEKSGLVVCMAYESGLGGYSPEGVYSIDVCGFVKRQTPPKATLIARNVELVETTNGLSIVELFAVNPTGSKILVKVAETEENSEGDVTLTAFWLGVYCVEEGVLERVIGKRISDSEEAVSNGPRTFYLSVNEGATTSVGRAKVTMGSRRITIMCDEWRAVLEAPNGHFWTQLVVDEGGATITINCAEGEGFKEGYNWEAVYRVDLSRCEDIERLAKEKLVPLFRRGDIRVSGIQNAFVRSLYPGDPDHVLVDLGYEIEGSEDTNTQLIKTFPFVYDAQKRRWHPAMLGTSVLCDQ